MKMEEKVEEIIEGLKDSIRYYAPPSVINDAKIMAREADLPRGIPALEVAKATVYLACEKCACPVPQRVLKVRMEHLRKLREKFQMFYPSKPSHWAPGIFSRLEKQGLVPSDELKPLRDKFEELCKIYESSDRGLRMTFPRSSRLIALALLCIAAKILYGKPNSGFKTLLSLRSIANAFFVTEPSVRKVVRSLLSWPMIKGLMPSPKELAAVRAALRAALRERAREAPKTRQVVKPAEMRTYEPIDEKLYVELLPELLKKVERVVDYRVCTLMHYYWKDKLKGIRIDSQRTHKFNERLKKAGLVKIERWNHCEKESSVECPCDEPCVFYSLLPWDFKR